MTFFLQDEPQQINIQARGVDTPPTSLWGGISASFQKSQLESNANFRTARENVATDDELSVEAARHMGADRIGPMVDAYNERARAAGMAERQLPADLADLPSVFGPNFSKAVLEEARKDPDWAGPDVSQEISEKRTTERMQKEYQDLTETLNATSGGAVDFAAQIAGGIGGMTADARNVPFLLLGGGTGSFTRLMGREAMLNVAAEGAFLPDQFKMAERLDIPEPDVAMTLAYAAAGGALIGGAVEGLARGMTYWRGTRTGQGSQTVPRYQQEANIDIAEDAIVSQSRPFEYVRGNVVERISPDPAISLARSPFSDSGINRQAADVEVPAAPRTTPRADLFDTPDARGGVGERQVDIEDLIAEATERDAQPESRAVPVEAANDQTVRSNAPVSAQDEDPLPQALERRLHKDAGGNKPLIDHIKRVYGGIRTGTRLAEELKSRGITSKTAPGLFRNTGRKGFDNIPASEEPHLAAILGDDGNGYLNEDAIAAAITDEVRGVPMHVSREQADAQAELDARREWQDQLDRRSAAAAGTELDEALYQMPEAPAWVDNQTEKQAITDYQTDDLRTHIEQAGDIFIGDRSASSILDELDADDDFADIVSLCGTRRNEDVPF